jgi:hypothetical protein
MFITGQLNIIVLAGCQGMPEKGVNIPSKCKKNQKGLDGKNTM